MADNRLSDNKNVLYLIIGVLAVAVAVLGFNLYQAKKQPERDCRSTSDPTA